MKSFLDEAASRIRNVILPKSPLGRALQYMRNHWDALRRYLDDGCLPIDNNDVEQLMKQIAIGRKNWLFAGSVAGGECSAGFFTLVSSAVRNDLDVWHYLADILQKVLDGCTDYEPFLPWNWAAEHPQHIRQYRIRERKERMERTRSRRAALRAYRARGLPARE